MVDQSAVQMGDRAATTPVAKKNARYYVFAAILLVMAVATNAWAVMSNGSFISAIPLAASVLYIVALVLVRKAWQSGVDEQKRRGLMLTGLCALIASLLSGAFLLIFSEAKHLDNTLHGMNLFRLYFIVGAGVGAMLGARLARMLTVKKIFVIKAFLISFALFAITGASQLNRLGGDADETHIYADVLKKDSDQAGLISLLSHGEPARFVYLLYDEGVERLILPKLLWNVVMPKATANLTVRAGYLGYPYVIELNDYPLQ